MATFAPRYARAFAQVAAAAHLDPDMAVGQMRGFSDLVAGNRELREALMNPSITEEQKLKVLDALTARLELLAPVRNFIAVVMRHERLAELKEIVEEYSRVADEEAGLSEAQISTAHPLNDEDKAQLEAQVARMAGGRVRTTYTEDPSLLGGAVIKIGSTVYDGSLKTQLADLKQRLMNAQFA